METLLTLHCRGPDHPRRARQPVPAPRRRRADALPGRGLGSGAERREPGDPLRRGAGVYRLGRKEPAREALERAAALMPLVPRALTAERPGQVRAGAVLPADDEERAWMYRAAMGEVWETQPKCSTGCASAPRASRGSPARPSDRSPARAARPRAAAASASAAHRVGPGVALEVEVEAVLPRALGDRPRLELGQVDAAPRRRRSSDLGRARPAGGRVTSSSEVFAGTSGRAGDRLARQLDEAGGVALLRSGCPRRSTSSPKAAPPTRWRSPPRVGSPRSRTLRAGPGGVELRLRLDPGQRCAGSPGTAAAPWGCESTVRRSSRRAPGSAEQAVLDAAHHLGGDGEAPLGEQVVGLVDAAGGRCSRSAAARGRRRRRAPPRRRRGRSRGPRAARLPACRRSGAAR